MKSDLNVILAEYADLCASGNPSRLAEMISRYPDHADELREYALFADVVAQREGALPENPRLERLFAEKATQVARRMRAESAKTPSPLASIVKDGAKQGLTPAALAQRLGLAVSFVARLDQRLFRPSSVPRELVDRLADALHRTAADVQAYLALPPRIAPAADYRASERPAAQEQIDFRAAVEAALDLSESQKHAWLAATED